MITYTNLSINLDLNDGVEEEEMAAIRRFLEIEQDRIAEDFGHVFGLTPDVTSPTTFTVNTPWTLRLKRWWNGA